MGVAWPEDVWESKFYVKVESNKSTSCFMFNTISRDVTHGVFIFIFIYFIFIPPPQSAHLLDLNNIIMKGDGT